MSKRIPLMVLFYLGIVLSILEDPPDDCIMLSYFFSALASFELSLCSFLLPIFWESCFLHSTTVLEVRHFYYHLEGTSQVARRCLCETRPRLFFCEEERGAFSCATPLSWVAGAATEAKRFSSISGGEWIRERWGEKEMRRRILQHMHHFHGALTHTRGTDRTKRSAVWISNWMGSGVGGGLDGAVRRRRRKRRMGLGVGLGAGGDWGGTLPQGSVEGKFSKSFWEGKAC